MHKNITEINGNTRSKNPLLCPMQYHSILTATIRLCINKHSPFIRIVNQINCPFQVALVFNDGNIVLIEPRGSCCPRLLSELLQRCWLIGLFIWCTFCWLFSVHWLQRWPQRWRQAGRKRLSFIHPEDFYNSRVHRNEISVGLCLSLFMYLHIAYRRMRV